MHENFTKALSYVLLDEGGNDDDPRDHGGRTSRGVTQREYDAFCRLNGKPTGDVWHCSSDDIAAVYRTQYWQPYCDTFPSGLDYLFFDMSVNCGRTQAVRTFQRALGVKEDGMLGQVTMDQITQQGSPDATSLIKRISDLRRTFYRHLKQYPIYGKGWLNRVDHSEQRALSLVTHEDYSPTPAPANKSNNVPATPTVPPEASGTATGGLLAILTQFKEQIEGLTSYIPNLNWILLGVAVTGFGYTAYSWYSRNKAQNNV